MLKIYWMQKSANCGSAENTALGRSLLGYALFRDFGIRDAEVVMTEKGKPYLRDHRDMHFSITHNRLLVAVALSDSPVGLDSETVIQRRFDRVSSRLFTENEQSYAGDDPIRFTEIWVRKESLGKLLGTGVTHGIRDMDVLCGDHVFIPVELEGTITCVCTEHAQQPEVYRINTEELWGTGNDSI